MVKKFISEDEIPFYTRVFNFISLALLAATWIVPLMAYDALPETVPSHFNLRGEVDGYGKKILVFLIPVIATFTTGILWFVMNTKNPYFSKFRKPGPYQIQLSEQAQHRVLSTTNLLTALLFLIVEMTMVESARSAVIPSYFFMIFVISGLLIILPLVEAFRSDRR